MIEQGELFQDSEIPALNPNPMVVRFGKHPNAKCKTCRFLFVKRYDKSYYKCINRGNTNGSGTDHRVRWDACSLYQEK